MLSPFRPLLVTAARPNLPSPSPSLSQPPCDSSVGSPDITHCPACGLPKLASHLCTNCLSTIRRDLKNAKRIQEHLARTKAEKEAEEKAMAEAKKEGRPYVVRNPNRPKNYLETGNPAPAPAKGREISRRPKVAAPAAEASSSTDGSGSS
jgi:ribosomal protein L32